MSIIGYARVSSKDQSLEIQEEQLKAAGCQIIRSEKRSGTTMNARAELATIMDFISKGDVLMVTRLDRLARNVADLSSLVAKLGAKGASLKVLNQNIDTATATGNAFLQMLGVFAEFETSLRKERQREGIDKALTAGTYKGRPVTIDAEQVRKLRAEGKGATQIAEELKVGRASVYRVLGAGTTTTTAATGSP